MSPAGPPRRNRFTREQVAEALETWIVAHESGVFTQAGAKKAMNAVLNTPARGGYDNYDFTTEMQAVRVLEIMVRDGKLRRVGKGETGPDGRRNSTRQPFYYTPAAWQAAEAEWAERMRTEAAVAGRWARVYDELVKQGCYPLTDRGKCVRLSSATWFGLLGLDGD